MRRVPRRTSLTLAVCTALACACSGGSGGAVDSSGQHRQGRSASSVTAKLGAVPIPTAPKADPTPVASVKHPQLLAIGAPVKVVLPGAEAVVTALGPFELTPYGKGNRAPTSTVGIITVDVVPIRGSIQVSASDFLSRDQTGSIVSLNPDGASTVTATAAHPAKVRIKGRYVSGAAQVTWRYHGHVMAIWDFNIELD